MAVLTALDIEIPVQFKQQRPYVPKTVQQLADEYYELEKALAEFQCKRWRDLKDWLIRQLPKNG